MHSSLFSRLNKFFRCSSKETPDLLTYEHRIKEQFFVDKLVSISVCKMQTLVSLKSGILVSTISLVKIKFYIYNFKKGGNFAARSLTSSSCSLRIVNSNFYKTTGRRREIWLKQTVSSFKSRRFVSSLLMTATRRTSPGKKRNPFSRQHNAND